MKRIWRYLFVLCSLCVFAACSDDKGSPEEAEICPFRNAALQQTTVKVGDVVTISGEGFASTLNLYLRSEYIKIQVDAPEIAAEGNRITFTVPDIEGETYKVIIEQEGEWALNEKLTIEKTIETVTRKLLGYTFDNGMEADKNEYFEFRFTWQGDSLMTVKKVNPENEDQLLDYFFFDYSSPDTILVRANMSVVNPSGSQTGVQNYFKIIVNNNRVKNVFINSRLTEDWKYTDKGYLNVAYNSLNGENGYTFDPSGNLTVWDFGNRLTMPTRLAYDKKELNKTGIDFGAFYSMIMISGINTPEFYAHILHLTGKTSFLLPSGVRARKNGEDVVYNFDYVMDEQGFVTEVTSIQTVNVIIGADPIPMEVTRKFTFTWE